MDQARPCSSRGSFGVKKIHMFKRYSGNSSTSKNTNAKVNEFGPQKRYMVGTFSEKSSFLVNEDVPMEVSV